MYNKFSKILKEIIENIKLFELDKHDKLKDLYIMNSILLESINNKHYRCNKKYNSDNLIQLIETVDFSNITVVNKNITLDQSSINLLADQIYLKYIDSNKYNLKELPDNLAISVMSTTGKINSIFHLENINNYLILSNNDILYIKYKGKQRHLSSVVLKKSKNEVKSFENQLTMIVRINNDSDKVRQINIKIFKNGSFQMTGCKSIDDCNIVINKILKRFKSTYAIIENDNIVEKPFMDNITNPSVINFKIDMINSNFNIGYEINGEKLYNILQNNKMTCRYEPCMHPGVNIKYKITEDKEIKVVSVFVFQSGNIIITGAKNRNQITKTYEYIKNILNINKNNIIKKNLLDLLNSEDLGELINKIEL